jgi:uncharacterized protein (DUF4415 family)
MSFAKLGTPASAERAVVDGGPAPSSCREVLIDDQCIGNFFVLSRCTYISQYDELHSLRVGRSESLKRKLATELQRLAARQDEEVDLSDIPELDEAFFREAEWRPPIKKPVTIRLDADVLEWFRSEGPGYQTRINRLLRRYMEVQQRRR